MEIQIAVAKVGKYATSESGDSLEMIERPHGGISLVLADGQRSGHAAKAISNMVTSKAIALLADGVRDGAAARAAHDYLYTARRGKVSATLNIVSVDMVTKTLVLSRNSHCPIVVHMGDGEQRLLNDPAPPIGVHRVVKPQIAELPIEVGMLAVVYTDGVEHAGSRSGRGLDAPALIASLVEAHSDADRPAQHIADAVLAEAVRCDDGRPKDDISVLVVAVLSNGQDSVRRLQATLPIPPLLLP